MLKQLSRIGISFALAAMILTAFGFFYSNTPLQYTDPDGATDYRWEGNRFFSQGTEGFSAGFIRFFRRFYRVFPPAARRIRRMPRCRPARALKCLPRIRENRSCPSFPRMSSFFISAHSRRTASSLQ